MKRLRQNEWATILITKPNGEEIQIHDAGDKSLVCRSSPCACFFLGPVMVELLIRRAWHQGWQVKRFRLGEFWRYKHGCNGKGEALGHYD